MSKSNCIGESKFIRLLLKYHSNRVSKYVDTERETAAYHFFRCEFIFD